jgi:hypothetical protein
MGAHRAYMPLMGSCCGYDSKEARWEDNSLGGIPGEGVVEVG